MTCPRAVALATAMLLCGAVPIAPTNVLFGHAIKNGPLPPATELTTFEHNCTVAPCVITQMHFPSIYPTSGERWDWQDGRLRVYVDGESVPSVDVSLLEIAHVGALGSQSNSPPADGSPFGHELFGKTASSGGVYTTVRIPFATSVRTTIQAPPTANASSIFWFIIRGIEDGTIALGPDLVLPDQARMQVWRNTNVTMQPLDFITLASADASTSGAVHSVFFDIRSSDPNFLEACVRFYPNGATNPIFLSSGTEDYFLSASYFDEGRFTTSQSGLTYTDGHDFSMYKVHERDYLLWQTGMNLTWRNYENSCPTTWPWPGDEATAEVPTAQRGRVGVAPASANTLVWGYVWPASADKLTFRGRPSGWWRNRAGSSSAAALARLDGMLRADAIELTLGLAARRRLVAGDADVLALFQIFAASDEALLATKLSQLLAK